MTLRTLGLVGITLVSAFAGISGVVVDFTASHIYNPAWPPYAQFHGYLSIARTVLIMASAVVLPGGRYGGNPSTARIFRRRGIERPSMSTRS